MEGVFTKFNFAFISGNDETQKTANISLLIHYHHFLIQLEIIKNSLGNLAEELNSVCAVGHALSLSRERNHSFLNAESKQENGRVKSKYTTEVLDHLDKMLTALFVCLFSQVSSLWHHFSCGRTELVNMLNLYVLLLKMYVTW